MIISLDAARIEKEYIYGNVHDCWLGLYKFAFV